MQKNQFSYFIIALIVAALVAIFLLAYRVVHRPANTLSQKVATTQQALLVVDYDNDGALNQSELLKGTDAILLVRTQTPSRETQFFNSLSALQRLDLNKDGRIDRHDPIYSHLELMFLTKDGQGRKYIPITQTTISSIIFNTQRLKNATDAVKRSTDNVAGYALMENGKRVDIRLISVEVY